MMIKGALEMKVRGAVVEGGGEGGGGCRYGALA